MNNHKAIFGRQITLTAGYLELDKFLLHVEMCICLLHNALKAMTS